MNLDLLIIEVVKVLLIFHVLLGIAALMTFMERRFAGWAQYRIGPNRVGPQGLLQPVADLIKLLFKECPLPQGAHPVLFRMAPLFAAIPSILTFIVVPFGSQIEILGYTVPMVGADIDVGLLYLFAIGSLSVYGIILAGWASNSKYSLLGGLRSSAQVISYELGMILAVIAVIIVSGTLNLREVVAAQEGQWNLFQGTQFLGFIIFLIAAFAETNRHPFDFAECESELVAGFHTEYSSMKFGLFYLGEYAAMFTMSAMLSTLWLGGPLVPGMAWETTPWWAGMIAFFVKSSFFVFLFYLARWSLPRLRFDQLMGLGWKVLLPLALVHVILTGMLETF